MPKKKVRIYFDFDGTLTPQAGEATFKTDVPKMLELDTEKSKESRAKFLDDWGVKRPSAGPQDTRPKYTHEAFGLQEKAKKFILFLNKLRENPELEVEMVIVSRNYENYIRAVLEHNNAIDPKIFNKIIDRGVVGESGKGTAVLQYENEHGKADDYYVFDDSKNDLTAMLNALPADANVRSLNARSGSFPFDSMHGENKTFELINKFTEERKQPTPIQQKQTQDEESQQTQQSNQNSLKSNINADAEYERRLNKMNERINELVKAYSTLEKNGRKKNFEKIVQLQKDLQEINEDKKMEPKIKLENMYKKLDTAFIDATIKDTVKTKIFKSVLVSYREIIDNLNKKPNDHHYKRLVGLLLRDAATLSDKPDKYSLSILQINKKHKNYQLYEPFLKQITVTDIQAKNIASKTSSTKTKEGYTNNNDNPDLAIIPYKKRF